MVDFPELGEHLPSDSSVLIFASTDGPPLVAVPVAGGGVGDADGESTRMGESEHGHLPPPLELYSSASSSAAGWQPPPGAGPSPVWQNQFELYQF